MASRGAFNEQQELRRARARGRTGAKFSGELQFKHTFENTADFKRRTLAY